MRHCAITFFHQTILRVSCALESDALLPQRSAITPKNPNSKSNQLCVKWGATRTSLRRPGSAVIVVKNVLKFFLIIILLFFVLNVKRKNKKSPLITVDENSLSETLLHYHGVPSKNPVSFSRWITFRHIFYEWGWRWRYLVFERKIISGKWIFEIFM